MCTISDGWKSVNRATPCPICDRDHNCKISADGGAVWCGRRESSRQNAGGQWLWRLDQFGQWQPSQDGMASTVPNPRPRIQRDPAADALAEKLRDRSRKSTASYYQRARTDRKSLAPWAERLGIPVRGLERMQVREHGAYLFYPEEHSREGRNLVFGGFGTRSRDGEKKIIQHSLRGCTMWAASNVERVHCVEGMTDSAIMAANGLSVVSRPNNQLGAPELALLLEDFEQNEKFQLIVWGENDQKENGRWPGREGAEKVAQDYADETLRIAIVVLPPEGTKDVRTWWHQFCGERGCKSHNPTAAIVREWRAMLDAWIKEHGVAIGVNDEVRQEHLSCEILRLRDRYKDALQLGNCGVWAQFAKGMKDAADQWRYFSLKLRCKCSNTCESCAAAKEADFAFKLLRTWQRLSLATVHRYEVSEEEADRVLRRVRSLDGNYAWTRTARGTRVIWSDIDLSGRLLDVAGATDFLWLDVETSDRKCDGRRMFVSTGWRLPEDEDDGGDAGLAFFGFGSRYAMEAVARQRGKTLNEIDCSDHKDYRSILESNVVGTFEDVQDFADAVQAMADYWKLAEATDIRFRPDVSSSPTSFLNRALGELDEHRSKPSVEQGWLGFGDSPPPLG